MRKSLIIIIFSMSFGQGLQYEITDFDHFLSQEKSIQTQHFIPSIGNNPYRQTEPSTQINLLSSKYSNVILSPILALRYSSMGFQMDPSLLSIPVIWVTPGLSVDYIQPIFGAFSDIWIHAWNRFYKHSAYGIENYEEIKDFTWFEYSTEHAITYHVGSEVPENGMEFDEGQGGISIMSSTTIMTFGSYSPKVGPSPYSNLSLSSKAPPFAQFYIHHQLNDKMTYQFIVGELESLIPIITEGESASLNLPRHLFYHRLDWKFLERFKIAFYEMIISGGDKSKWAYINPLQFYWSAQHAGGDQDNLMMGIDLEWLWQNNRIWGGIILDEWNPFNTFNKDHHNWFAYQMGLTHLQSILNQNFLLSFEYTWASPQIYIHDIPRNMPEHHGYPIGFWAGGHSDQWIAEIQTMINHKTWISLKFQNTRKGEPGYGVQANGFNPNTWSRDAVSLKMSKSLLLPDLYIDLTVMSLHLQTLESDFNTVGADFTVRYNIAD